ncbi:MAG: enoyl-CoA hydratase/isomerase family protein [Promethearchaeota archaeon]|jgi:enoyl-CoA hydratase
MSSNELNLGEYIEFSIKRRFGIITLNRVSRSNAFTIEQLEYLKKALIYCQQSNKVKGLILTANGDSFSTGMDLGAVTSYDYERIKKLEQLAAQVCELLYNGKPSICAINGRTLGEGVVFLICCDYRIAINDSFFQMPEINSAIFPGTGCVILFSKIIGIPWTKKMLMFSEKIDAAKALEIGLIDQIVNSKEELLNVAMEKAKFLYSRNQIVLNAIKLLSNHLFDKTFEEGYELEKVGSDWYKFQNKNEMIINLREKFNWNP